ncbi:MAG TPA: hypothetical protein PKA64_05945 [Myxococcota bacterium]|nr:hypothetical protein [Myxococcota bacterium]
MANVKQALNTPLTGRTDAALEAITFGELIEEIALPKKHAITLASSATYTLKDANGRNQPARVLEVLNASNVPLTKIYTGAPGAGEVKIVYDANYVPTFTFNAAVTAFSFYGPRLPYNIVAGLAKELI